MNTTELPSQSDSALARGAGNPFHSSERVGGDHENQSLTPASSKSARGGNGSFPEKGDGDGPITSSEINTYLLARLVELNASHGYADISVGIHGGAEHSRKAKWQVAMGASLITGCGHTFEDALADQIRKVGGRSEVEILRAEAARMLAKAASLEIGEEGA
ncbi:MAG TPA: hypothetical protein VF258_08740 [Luteolibacter sp.]